MAVLTPAIHLVSVIGRLQHPELQWVLEFDYRLPNPINSGPPHREVLRRMPLLISGKAEFRLRGGDDVIEVPLHESSDGGIRRNNQHEVGMALIMEWLTQPGGTVCDPLMFDRSHCAVEAWQTGRYFIGATDCEASLIRIQNSLVRLGAFPIGKVARQAGSLFGYLLDICE